MPSHSVAAIDSAVFADSTRPFRGFQKSAHDIASFSELAYVPKPHHVFASDSVDVYERCIGGVGSHAVDSAKFTDVASCALYLGRYRRGDTVQLPFSTSAIPDAAPVVVILDSKNVQIASFAVPATDKTLRSFACPLFIGQTFSLGSFTAYCHYAVQGTASLTQVAFDVITGGDSGGSVVSLHSVDRPEARSIIAQLGCGRLVLGANPRLN